MKKIVLSTLALTALLSVSASAFDPSSMTQEEREAFRTEMQSMSSEERSAFKDEMKSQMNSSSQKGHRSGPQDGSGKRYKGKH